MTTRAGSGTFRVAALSALMAVAGPASAADGETAPPPPSWQNPDLGVVADIVTDAHDAEGAGTWRTEGVRVRAVELSLSSNIDPYASLDANVFVSPEGAELHELFARFPALPGGLSAKAGQMLANFGRWSRFHPHATPFASEPRILHEYAGGGLLQTGAELSWLLPLDRFAEISVGVYDRIEGHSHDPDPASLDNAVAAAAADLGCTSHGSHYDCPNGEILYPEDLEALAGGDGKDPLTRFSGRKLSDMALGARAVTTAEFGRDWSLDMGVSGMYQHGYARSQRLHGKVYPKGMFGADFTFFWHPLSRAAYRGMDFGIEAVGNYEGSDVAVDSVLTREYYAVRGGAFGYLRWKQSQQWQFGGFAEAFQARDETGAWRRRYGVFATYGITHYQYLRLEGSRYHLEDGLRPVHRVMLQYDAVIGYHTHGVQR
jgi:hypothetical protein